MEQLNRVIFTSDKYKPYFTFWKKFLNTGPGLFDYRQKHTPESEGGSKEFDRHVFAVDGHTSKKINDMVGGQDNGVMVIMAAAVGLVLSKYSEQKRVILSTPTFGLKGVDMKYVNHVPVILDYEPGNTLRELLVSVQNSMGEFYRFQNFPLALIDYASNSNKIFSTNISFEFEHLHDTRGDSQEFSLNIKVSRSEGNINVALQYDKAAFDHLFVENFSRHLQEVLQRLDNLDTRLAEMNPGPNDEQMALINRFNATGSTVQTGQTVVEAFEAQANKTPDNIALSYKGTDLTYKELNQKANALAQYIKKEHHVTDEEIVGVMVGRSIDMVVAILGVLKAGCAYLPIDPDYPKERIKYILDDAAIKLLLTEVEFMFSIPDYPGEVVALDIQLPALADDEKFEADINPDQLAYVIYTSGSTGMPKGVMVPHKGCMNMLSSQMSVFQMSETDVTLQFASISFDASVSEIFKTLLVGARLVIMDKNITNNPQNFTEFMKAERVTVVTLPPSYMTLLNIEELSFLRMVISAGEAANIRHALEFSKHGKYFNAYGPTECSVCVSIDPFTPDSDKIVTIGHPIANMQVHLVTNEGNISPLGLAGEICVSGEGLARGYLNAPELTHAKFVSSPQDANVLMYKTGDIGRWLANGKLDFIGRKDDQVKIRGYRIELGEIEKSAMTHPAVKESAAVIRKDGNGEEQIVVFYTTEEDLRASELRNFLQTLLPAYMIPSHLAKVPHFNYSQSGKVDRKALPEISMISIETDYVSPKTALEKKLVDIWQEQLGKARIGINDNFFAIGGDSIKAIRIVVEMNKVVGMQLEVNDIFSHNTISDLVKFATDKDATDKPDMEEVYVELERFKTEILENKNLVLPENIEDIIPMGDIQKGMVFHSLIGAEAGIYKEQMYFQIKDEIFDIQVFNQAINLMVKKHPILRTSFLMEEGVAAQIIHSYSYNDSNLFFEDISDKAAADQKNYLQKALLDDKYTGLRLNDGVLWRITVFKLAQNEHAVLFSCNHALVDGWSNASLMTELSHVYYTLKEKRDYDFPMLKASYKDYIAEQIQISRSQSIKNFWREELSGYTKLPLPFNKQIDHGGAHQVSNYTFDLPVQLTNDIVEFASSGVSSVKHIFLSAFSYLMRLTTNENDVIFGLVTNSRPEVEDSEKIIGCFTNTVPFRTQLDVNNSGNACVSRIDEQARKLKAYDKLSMIEIMKVIHEETTSGNPIFDIIFNFVDFHIYEQVHANSDVNDGIIDDAPRGNTNTYFDFTVCKSDRKENKFIVNLNYRAGLYDPDEIERIFSYYTRILSHLVYKGDATMVPTNFYLPEDFEISSMVNKAPTDVLSSTIVEQFEKQVELTPDHTALVADGQRYSYDEVNKKVNRLGHYLREEYNIQPGDLVGLMMGRSADFIFGMLGILKAGAGYVPVSVDNPNYRKKTLLKDTNVKLLITESEHMFSLIDYYDGAVFALDIQIDDVMEYPTDNPNHLNGPGDLAYVMFTSGSTGTPKGVMIKHENVVNLVANPNFVSLAGKERLLQTGAVSFDATTFEYWGMLLNGGELHIITDKDLLDVRKLSEAIKEKGISTMWFTSSWFNQLVDFDITIFKSLQQILVGGDKLSPHHISRVRKQYPHLKIVNGYGPTETTTFAVCHHIEKDYLGAVPIGKPVQNARIYLLDKDGYPVLPGVSGEIHIGGAGVGAGYLGHPQLTNEKFVYHSMPGGSAEKLYRTGDYGKILPDGNIGFIGRKDDQVKVRGYRIELGEIERALCSHNDIDEARVLIKPLSDGNGQLLAFVTGRNRASMTELTTYLKNYLPEYMCPEIILYLESFPLTPNGKVDVNKLPDPQNYREDADSYVAPENEVERVMVTVWESVLGREKIGIHDNFFMIGGDSIKAIQVSSRLHREGYQVEVKDIFTYPLIVDLAREAKKITRDIDQSEVVGEVPLTPVQLDFFATKKRNQAHFNQSVLLAMDDRLNADQLSKVFLQLTSHHDMLRAVFTEHDGKVQQQILASLTDFHIDEVDLRSTENEAAELEATCDKCQRSVNLSKGPLAKVILFHLKDSDRLFIAVHHLVIDGVSWRILLEDLDILLKQEITGEPFSLPLKTDSYLSWANALQLYADSSMLQEEQSYWLELASNGHDEVPILKAVDSNKINDAKVETIELSEQATSLFLTGAHHAFNTQANDLLLSALGISLFKTFNLRSALISLEGHGREEIAKGIDISRTIGWFTSIFPVALQNLEQEDMSRLIKETKENLRNIPGKGVGFGVLKYLNTGENKVELDMLHPQISFNYLGQFDAEMSNTSFSFAKESAGNSVNEGEDRVYDLDITGLVLEGKLKFNISYNPAHFKNGVMDVFCEQLKAATTDVITYCAQQEEGEVTPDDLTHKGVSMDLLDSINEMIK